MLRKNYWHFILICMLIALISGIGYASFISIKYTRIVRPICVKSTGKSRRSFASLTNTNWNMLMDWNEYF